MTTPAYQEEWITGPQNTRFFTRRYGPPAGTPAKAIIVFAHGFIEHIARLILVQPTEPTSMLSIKITLPRRYEHVFPLYAARDIAVFAFDQRGFGQTSLHEDKSDHSSYAKTSWLEQMADIDFFLGREIDMRGKGAGSTTKVFLMGHSMVCPYLCRIFLLFSVRR
jgi:acylglycerol lipase